MDETEEILEVVAEINDELEANFGIGFYDIRDNIAPSIVTCGHNIVIKFLGFDLWSSMEDERDFIEALGGYEPLYGYLKKEMGKVLDAIAKAHCVKIIKGQ